MKKILIILTTLTLTLSQLGYALVCPTPAQIKAGNFNGFTPIDIDNDEPVSPSMIKYFQQHVDRFKLAEFMGDTRYPSHCYYLLNDQHGWSQTYLGNKRNIKPTGTYWHKKLDDFLQCTQSISACTFS